VIGRGSEAHGIVIVDKPVGPTSHDVVAGLRRALGTRAVGHAGTLDPAASGVLVVAVGEATKLLAHLSSSSKRYLATVQFGTSTSTCDRDGDVLAQESLPADLAAALAGHPCDRFERALEEERRRGEQVPPQFSAIKVQGRRAHQLARRGEHVPLSPRTVRVHELVVLGTRGDSIDLLLHVSKGYYVRALARDLGHHLGVPSHLSALRRTASDPFTIEESVPSTAAPEALMQAGLSLSAAARRIFAACELTEEGVRRAGHGQGLTVDHFASPPAPGVCAWFDPVGRLVALGRGLESERFAPLRVFAHLTSSSAI